MHRSADAAVDRHDPEKILASLKLQGAKVTRIQMRTLCFDDRDQMERLLRCAPEIGEVFICLFRGDLEKKGLDLSTTPCEGK